MKMVEKLDFMEKLNLKFAIWREGKHFVAQCLNVDVSSFGDSKKTAQKNLEEALGLYFEDVKNPKITRIEKVDIVSILFDHA